MICTGECSRRSGPVAVAWSGSLSDNSVGRSAHTLAGKGAKMKRARILVIVGLFLAGYTPTADAGHGHGGHGHGHCHGGGGSWGNCGWGGGWGWGRSILYVGSPWYYNPWFSGYGYGYPNYGYPYGGAYGSTGSSIEAALLQLQNQNQQLKNEIDKLKNPGQQPVQINVQPGNKKTAEEIAQLQKGKQRERARQSAANGQKLFSSGSYIRAAERFREGTRYDPEDASNHFYLAQSLFAAKQYSDAAQALKNGLKINPDWVDADFDVRTMYKDEDELGQQLASLAGAIKANPLDRDALYLLGFELFASGQKKNARTILEQVARLEPDDVHVKPFFDHFTKLEEAVADQKEVAPPPAAPKPADEQMKRMEPVNTVPRLAGLNP